MMTARKSRSAHAATMYASSSSMVMTLGVGACDGREFVGVEIGEVVELDAHGVDDADGETLAVALGICRALSNCHVAQKPESVFGGHR